MFSRCATLPLRAPRGAGETLWAGHLHRVSAVLLTCYATRDCQECCQCQGRCHLYPLLCPRENGGLRLTAMVPAPFWAWFLHVPLSGAPHPCQNIFTAVLSEETTEAEGKWWGRGEESVPSWHPLLSNSRSPLDLVFSGLPSSQGHSVPVTHPWVDHQRPVSPSVWRIIAGD